MNSSICLYINDQCYYVEKLPFETDRYAYKRAWWILKNNLDLDNVEHIDMSIQHINRTYFNMTYKDKYDNI